MRGRPLRFLALTLGAWTAGRVAMLSMDAAPLSAPAATPAPARAATPPPGVRASTPMPRLSAPMRASLLPGSATPRPSARPLAPWYPAILPQATARPVAQGRAGVGAAAMHGSPAAEMPALPPPLVSTPPPPPGRWAGSVWGIARGAGDDRSVPGAQLGGSQAGLRLAYALGDHRRVALAGRVSTPLEGRGREAALGVEWRPLDAPIRFLAEQRWSLDGGRGGPTVTVAGGIPPTRIGPLVAEAYAQAGAIARGRIDGFADGAARVAMPLPVTALPLDLGIGAWGGVQPGAARLDVGPSLGARISVGNRRLRVTLDWRQRVAGRARPGSGPALSIGSDF